jgi:hypothetical protein
VRVPINAPPIMLPAKGDEAVDKRFAGCTAAIVGCNEEILKIADRLQAPGMRVKHVVGETNRSARLSTGQEAPNRLIWGQNSTPDSLSDRLRDIGVECRSVAVPKC